MKSKSLMQSLTALAILGCLLVACKKDDVPQFAPSDKLLFNWKMTNVTTPKISQSGDSSLYKVCMTDDLFKFTQSGFEFSDGVSKCDSSIVNYSKGTWKKSSSDSLQLTSINPTKYASWKIVTLNDSILQVKFIDSTNVLKKISKTISFKH